MYHNQTRKYADVIQDTVDRYNATIHSTTGMKPKDVNDTTQLKLWAEQYLTSSNYAKHRKKPFYKFDINDFVRLSFLSNVFSREFDQKWTGEIFKVSKRYAKQGFPIYELKVYDDEPSLGRFYEEELQKAESSVKDLFKVEKILRRKGKGKNQQFYVRWLFWPSK